VLRKFKRRLARWLIKKLYREEHLLREFAIGMNSFIDKSKNIHMVLLDYDTESLESVIEDARELISFFGLAKAEVFRTQKGFHVFFWHDHVPYSRLRMIIDYSRCDEQYKYISRYYDHKTIRASGKYSQLDTSFVVGLRGARTPTQEQLELGLLKRREYFALRQMHEMLNKEGLKDNEGLQVR
jgi:hypothetical protein